MSYIAGPSSVASSSSSPMSPSRPPLDLRAFSSSTSGADTDATGYGCDATSPLSTSDEPPATDADADGDADPDAPPRQQRRRGQRLGKSRRAALEAARNGLATSPEARDAQLAALAAASEEFARETSAARQSPFGEADFPPLAATATRGTPTPPPAEAEAKRSKFRALLGSKGNPQLEALARRVREREGESVGNRSAPAKLQHVGGTMSGERRGGGGGGSSGGLGGAANFGAGSYNGRPHAKAAVSMSSGFSSQLSSLTTVSSATTSSGGRDRDDDDWRRPRGRDRAAADPGAPPHAPDGWRHGRGDGRSGSRARDAAAAAAAITSGFGPMGSFGRPADAPAHGPLRPHAPRHARSAGAALTADAADQPGGRHPRPAGGAGAPVHAPASTAAARPVDIARSGDTSSAGGATPTPTAARGSGAAADFGTSASTVNTIATVATVGPGPGADADSAAAAPSPVGSQGKSRSKSGMSMGGLAKMFGGMKAK